MHTKVLGNIGVDQFLSEYWQRKPLLLRNALAFASPIDANELAGLAMEPDIDARLVLQYTDPPWQVRTGPFSEEALSTLPEKGWVLLVNGVNTIVPQVHWLLDEFLFVPSWRIDDMMVSYSPEGGSVGPHVDMYDVFLIQVQGKKQWRIAESFSPAILPNLHLRILESFHAEQVFELEPGDILYLPPNVAHHGIAVDGPSMTYSLGFRAPPQCEIISGYYEDVAQRMPDAMQLYRDPGLRPAPHGEITPETLTNLEAIIRKAPLNADHVGHWFARTITEQGRAEALEEPLNTQAFLRKFKRCPLCVGEHTRINYFIAADRNCQLYINGTCHALPENLTTAAQRVSGSRRWPYTDFAPFLLDQTVTGLLHQWYALGMIVFEDEYE